MKSQQNCKHKNCRKIKTSGFPLLIGLLIALIPKCPFCVLAYSSAIALCSGAKVYIHHPGWTSWISILLAILTLIMVFVNFRGLRTYMAIVLILVGTSFIAIAEFRTGSLAHFYCGSSIILVGVWLNASMLYVLKFLSTPFYRLISKSQINPSEN